MSTDMATTDTALVATEDTATGGTTVDVALLMTKMPKPLLTK